MTSFFCSSCLQLFLQLIAVFLVDCSVLIDAFFLLVNGSFLAILIAIISCKLLQFFCKLMAVSCNPDLQFFLANYCSFSASQWQFLAILTCNSFLQIISVVLPVDGNYFSILKCNSFLQMIAVFLQVDCNYFAILNCNLKRLWFLLG